jgi:hypothetical protein
MLVESEIEMAKKMELLDKLLTIFMFIVIGYTAYLGITLSSSPNFLKELQGSYFIFLTLADSDLLALDTIYYVAMKGTQRHGTARSLKAGTIIKRILGFAARVLVPLTIVLTVLVTIYFFIVFITSAFLLTLSKSLMLYIIFITTVLMYFVVMYFGIKVWRYKRALKSNGYTVL